MPMLDLALRSIGMPTTRLPLFSRLPLTRFAPFTRPEQVISFKIRRGNSIG